jgi:diketogulonate reductase-like aldo/keto reductase
MQVNFWRTFRSFLSLTALIHVSVGCTTLTVTVTEHDDLNALAGTYKLDPTWVGNGRPVFLQTDHESDPPRKIYHYARTLDADVDDLKTEWRGRWIIGDDIRSDHGWAMLNTWSISPAQSFVNALHSIDSAEPLLEWAIADGRGDWMNSHAVHVECAESDDAADEVMFITTADVFREVTGDSGDSLNYQSIHGYYYKLTDSVWRHIDSTVFLQRSEIKDNSWHFFGGNDAKYAWTLVDLPDMNVEAFHDVAAPFGADNGKAMFESRWRLVAQTAKNALPINGEGWHLLAPKSTKSLNTISVTALTTSAFSGLKIAAMKDRNVNAHLFIDVQNRAVTVIDAMKEYYRQKKLTHPWLRSRAAAAISSFESAAEKQGTDLTSLSAVDRRAQLRSHLYANGVAELVAAGSLPMAAPGFGTGMIQGYENNVRAIANAVNEAGFALIDSATEYDSERPIGDLLRGGVLYHGDADDAGDAVAGDSELLRFTQYVDKINGDYVRYEDLARGDKQRDDVFDLKEMRLQRKRDELFLVTKVWPTDHGYLEAQGAWDLSMRLMGLNYLDSLMIHWPECHAHWPFMDCSRSSGKSWKQSWQVMMKLYAEGRVLSLGVSNFDKDLIQQALDIGMGAPHIVQNAFELWNQAYEFTLMDWLEREGAVFQAYAPLRGLVEADDRLDNEPHFNDWMGRLEEISSVVISERGEEKSPYQVWFRYLLDKHIAFVTRSQNVSHMKDNLNVFDFELSEDEQHDLFVSGQKEEL